jgi:hypothetical protein
MPKKFVHLQYQIKITGVSNFSLNLNSYFFKVYFLKNETEIDA